MRFELLAEEIDALCSAATPAAAAVATPQLAARPWQVLFRRRNQPLLVPVGQDAFARAALDFFVPGRLLRLWGRVGLRLHRHWPAGRVQAVRLPPFPTTLLFGPEVPGCPRALALCCGTPGPLRKLIALAGPAHGRLSADGLSADGSAPCETLVAKIALRPSADRAVERETYWLRRMGAVLTTAGQVPALRAAGTLPGGRRYVVMRAVPGGLGNAPFGPAHAAFLAALAGHDRSFAAWSDSAALSRLETRLVQIAPVISTDERRLLAYALQAVERGIGRQVLPACTAHGDFTPWNVRQNGRCLQVFDWEYAQDAANPLQDFLHFHLMARIASGRTPGGRWIAQLLQGARAHGAALFEGHRRLAAATPWLLLHYLIEIVSFYASESGQLDRRHPVVGIYLGLIATRERWCRGEA